MAAYAVIELALVENVIIP